MIELILKRDIANNPKAVGDTKIVKIFVGCYPMALFFLYARCLFYSSTAYTFSIPSKLARKMIQRWSGEKWMLGSRL